MQAVPIGMMVLGTAMKVFGGMRQSSALDDVASQQRAAAEQSQRIGEQNAAAIEAENRETVRREKLAAAEEASTRKAKAAASGGVAGYGSTANYLETQNERAEDYVKWLKESGASQAQIAREQGQYSYLQGMASARGTEAEADSAKWGAFGSLASGGSQLYSMWNS